MIKDISSGNHNLINDKNLRFCIEQVLNDNQYHGYSSPKGIKELRLQISSFLRELWKYEVDSSNMIITSGSQQSINLVIDAFLTEKDSILVEQPTYFGAMKIFRSKKINMIGISIHEDGIDLEELERKIIEEKPKAIYVVPTFNNPTGYAWSLENRIRFLELVNHYHLLVIEDDPYSMIHFTDQEYPSLYQLNHGKNIIYLGTFSKYISASINVGYILTEESTISKLYEYKEAYDLCTSLFYQQVILTYLKNFNLISEIENKISNYKKLLEKSLSKIKKDYGDYIEYTNPKGGLFFLVHIKKGSLPFQDKQMYFIDNTKDNYLRVNICSNLEE